MSGSNVSSERASADADFLSQSLAVSEVFVFSERAKEKLEDFANYLALLSDPNYDSTFKNYVSQQAADMFDGSQKNMILLDLSEDVKSGQHKAFISSVYNSEQLRVTETEVSEFEVTQQLIEAGDQLYQGVISYKLRLAGTHQNEPFNQTYHLDTQIILRKVPKDFGGDVENVWEVFLGNIEKK
ncbi:MAG: hypothetical protein AAFX87_04950 [Bacteroidota bacterium]